MSGKGDIKLSMLQKILLFLPSRKLRHTLNIFFQSYPGQATGLILFCTAFLLTPTHLRSQVSDTVSTDTAIADFKNSILVYPILFYLPETRFGGGLACIYTFRFRGADKASNPSQIRFSADITQNKQFFIQLPFELYTRNELWKFKGEIDFFNYFYYHYGVGNNTLAANRESYTVIFPRIRLDVLYQYKDLFAGIRYRLDAYGNLSYQQGGLIDTEGHPGKEGGNSISAGFLLQYDKRDFIYNPTKGYFLETEYSLNNQALGSKYHYQRFILNMSYYYSIFPEHILAFNTGISHNSGIIPFFDMPYFGSGNQGRGFQDRRFMDKNMFVAQLEYRYPIYKRFSGVAFGSISEVGASLKQLLRESLKPAAGLGLRYQLTKEERSLLRLDLGFTKEGNALYITINDAF
jgi:hypothetical protein